MGIKSINAFLKKKCPEAFKDIPYSFFRGKRMAIDSNNVFIKLMSRAHKEVINITDVCTVEPDRALIIEKWHDHIKEDIIKFLSYGITPIFVFDGNYIDEKGATQKKRRDEKAKRVNEASQLKKKILEADELERTPQMITDLRKKMHHLGNITKDDWENIRNILRALGFPVLFATEEGEKLCAMLCIEGKVEAVVSTDTDIVAMGCPISASGDAGWVYNPESKKTELALKCTIFRPLLSALEMQYDTFLDLCIMSGCDFNSNIFNLGVGKAYKLLKDCRSIDYLPEKFNDKREILNHVKCRDIFKRQLSKDICASEIVLNINSSSTNPFRTSYDNKYNLNEWIESLSSYFEDFPTPPNVYVEKIPSLNSSGIKMKIVAIDGKIPSSLGSENTVTSLVPVIPIQIASPIKVTSKMISSLAAQQLANYNEKQSKNVKLKILS
jgi:flap endonuclease-1